MDTSNLAISSTNFLRFSVEEVGLIVSDDLWGILKNVWRVFLLGEGAGFSGISGGRLRVEVGVREGPWKVSWVRAGADIGRASMWTSMKGA